MNVAPDIDGDGYRISFPALETVEYWECADGFLFHAGWGVTPPVVDVPSAEAWDEVTPAWLHGRRDLVLTRLTESGHSPQADGTTDWQYRMDPEQRRLRREE